MTIQPIIAWLGQQEMLIIFLIVLLLFGAKKLPELAKGLGKSAGEFKKAKDEFNREIQQAADEAERDWDRDVVNPKEAPSKRPCSKRNRICDPCL